MYKKLKNNMEQKLKLHKIQNNISNRNYSVKILM